MRKIIIPANNDFRRFFNPIILIFISIVLNTLFQLSTSDEKWNSFNIFNAMPNYKVLIISLVFYGFFLFGAISSYLFKCSQVNKVNSYIIYNYNFYKKTYNVIFVINIITLIIAQYYMQQANMINIYFFGNVTAQDIEERIISSPLGIHGLSLLFGYFGIIMFGIARLSGDKRIIVLISLIIIIIKLISYAKLQSLLYVLFAIMLFSRKKISLSKGIGIAFSIIALFSFTRIIRNPEQDLSLNFDFLFRFIGGFYFGSPVVNFSYVIQNNIKDLFYFFNWFLPQKIIPASDINLNFPDVTSPIGFVGSTYVSLGVFSFVYAYFVGFMVQYIYLQKNKTPFAYVFQPFLVMACIFSMMYNNFVNMNFFILPMIFSIWVLRKMVLRKKEIV